MVRYCLLKKPFSIENLLERTKGLVYFASIKVFRLEIAGGLPPCRDPPFAGP